jgi:phosphatidylserine/phosphatidylglycerophosphate/cardiolipin synthase-like enzyme
MKIIYFWIALFVLVYVGGLFFFYYNFPEKQLVDEGSFEFISCYEYNCSRLLIDLLNNSVESRCAFYDLGEDVLVDYLNNSGIETLVYEDNNDYTFTISVKIKGLMHHKFCVLDDEITVFGSANPTERGFYKNDNYLVVLVSDVVASKFNQEFERVKKEERIGSNGLKVNLSGSMTSVCFSPGNDCESQIVEEINKAKDSIDMLAFSFTSKSIGEALVNASLRNVFVRVVFEKTRISKYSQFGNLNGTNISVYHDGNGYTMHEKLILIDQEVVILGSYNPTQNANVNNDENLLIIHDNSLFGVAKIEFERVLNQSVLI